MHSVLLNACYAGSAVVLNTCCYVVLTAGCSVVLKAACAVVLNAACAVVLNTGCTVVLTAGCSVVLNPFYSLVLNEGCSASVSQFVESVRLNKKPFHLVGTSMGGNVAGVYAACYPAHISGLTLICPAGVCVCVCLCVCVYRQYCKSLWPPYLNIHLVFCLLFSALLFQ